MTSVSEAEFLSRALGQRPRTTTLDVALLVSTFQKPTHLARVLTSIAMQRRVEGRFEVVVTDDGSTDETPEVVERFARQVPFRVAYTTHPHETFQLARCRNEGVAASTAPYLLFIDGDCVLPADHVLRHLEHRRPNYVMGGYCCRLDQFTSRRITRDSIVSGQFLNWIPQSELRQLARRDRKARFYGWLRHPTKPKLAGGNIGIWRADYELVNGYNTRFQGWGGEDDDLRMRLARAGVRIGSILRWTHTVHLWHPPDPTAPARLRDGQNFDYLHNPGRLTRCRHGLVDRPLDQIHFEQVGVPQYPAAAADLLRGRVRLVPSDMRRESPEVEILFQPGTGKFSGRADCNLLIVFEASRAAHRLARQAHVLISDAQFDELPASRQFRLREVDRALAEIS